MILKWKTILTNWIHCYTPEGDKREQNITPENLLYIFTHIHESIRLDDSKSSKFEANTVQDFIVEKYPEFKFGNGTLESTTEEELYIIASLLLFFICVNSKNADIKRVMCNKLSTGDQETIMKFSKCLMDCSPILYADVEAAITEACGHDTSKVSETPPALRSLHGEVRRLQAALDAERFDRNYLQDELARTNLKLEKLTKVKEQYKLDILNLKAKISLCCGEKRESHREARADEFIGRLQRQLQELEASLEDTLGQLEDVQQERDTYKQKVNELKVERDKWLTLSQQEADRASQLADQLDSERRTVATLRDLVSELRQHNRNNGLDSSMLECDDPDTSIHSLSNLSVCNEVCANVIEVQLGEERAKIEILKQQIQGLQEQLNKASQNFESEKLSLEAVITEKESNLCKLKQRLSEEIEEKNNLKIHYDQEIDCLNKKIFEMSQMIKDVEETSKRSLEMKAQEIETLQVYFVNEKDKLNSIIKHLKTEVADVNILKNESDDKIAILNSQILEMTRTIKNLEENTKSIVEEKEQETRTLQKLFAAETEKSNNLIHELRRELKEQMNLKTHCEQEILSLNNKILDLSQIITNETEKSQQALEEKAQEIQTLQQQFAQETVKCSVLNNNLQKEIKEKNNMNTRHEQEVQKLKNEIEEITHTAQAAEEEFKISMEEKIQEIQILQNNYAEESKKFGIMTDTLEKEIEKQNSLRHNCEEENIRLNTKIDEMAQFVHELQRELKEQVNIKRHCEQEILALNNKILDFSQIITNETEKSQQALEEKAQEIQTLQQQFAQETEKCCVLNNNLQKEIKEKNNMNIRHEQEILKLKNEIEKNTHTAKATEEEFKISMDQKIQEIQMLQNKYTEETKKFGIMTDTLEKEIEKQNILRHNCEEENIRLNIKIDEMAQLIKNIEDESKHALQEKVQEIHCLQQELEKDTEAFSTVIKRLQMEIEEQTNLKTHCEQEVTELNNKILEMSQTAQTVEQCLKHALDEKIQEIKLIKQEFSNENKKLGVTIENLKKEIETQTKLKSMFEQENIQLNDRIMEMSQTINEVNENSKRVVEEKMQEIQSLNQQFSVESKTSGDTITKLLNEIEDKKALVLKLNNEIIVMSRAIMDVEENSKRVVEEKVHETQSLRQEFDNETKKSSEMITKLQSQVEEQKEEILKLNSKIIAMSQTIKNVEESSKLVTEEKLQEIQTLQQHFSEETKKLEIKNNIQAMEILEAYEMKKSCDQEIVKLNNEIDRMRATIEEAEQSSKLALEESLQEKHNLQQQLSLESEKLSNIIKDLNQELETEKEKQSNLKEDFENSIHKLNEKITNQSNELADLKKDITEKSEMTEQIKSDLRKEKQLKEQLSATCNNQLLTLNEQKAAIEELHKQLQENEIFKDKLDKDVKNLNIYVSTLEEKCRKVTEEKQKEVESLNQEIILLKNNLDKKSRAITDLEEISRHALLEKEQVMQTLHQQFAAESGKAENIIKNLKIELEAEKYAQLKLKDDLDNRLMKLNEKVLNRNNELVELQDNIIQKSELIEVLQSDLRREKELRDELSNTCNHQLSTLNEQKSAVEAIIQQKLQEITDLQKQTQEKEMLVIKLNNEVDKLNTTISSLEEKCRQRDGVIREKQKEIEFINDVFQNELEKLNHNIDECNASIKSLQMQLQNEIDYKMQLQHEFSELETSKQSLIEELNAAKLLAKDHEEKSLLWEKEKIEMSEQIKINIHKIEKIEKEKAMLLQEIESLTEVQSGETKNHVEKLLMFESKIVKLKEQLQTNILKVNKLTEEKELILKELEEVKVVQSQEAKNHGEKIRIWEKQTIEMNEQMQVNALNVEKLEDEKVLLLKEIEALKAARKREEENHEVKVLKWKEQQKEMKEQLQTNVLTIEKLEEEKRSLVKEHETNYLIWENEKVDLNEQMQAHIRKAGKLKDEKTLLVNDIEALKKTQQEDTKRFEENTLVWEKQMNEMNKQVQANIHKIETLQNEKALLLKEIKELKTFQSKAAEDREEYMVKSEKDKNELIEQMQANAEKHKDDKSLLVKEIEELKASQKEETNSLEETKNAWENQTTELKEQIQFNIVKVQELEEENAMLAKEIEALKAVQSRETKDYEEKTLAWEIQKTEMSEQIKSNVLNVQTLEEEKATLLKELDVLKAREKEEAKSFEEKSLVWETQKTEMNEQMQSNILKVQALEEEKAMLLKEIEAVKAAYHEEKTLIWEGQKTEMNDQIQANLLKVEKLQEDNAMLLKELEALKTAQTEMCFNKDHEEKLIMLESQEILMKEEMKTNARKIQKLEEEKIMLSKELEALKAAQKEILAMASHDKITGTKHTSWDKEIHGTHHQVDTTTSDLAHSSMDSLKTISDLEKIIQDKNRKITTMQTEITYIKSMMAESGIQFIDVTKELEVSKDTCQELSSQLKKIVHQKNEEIAELRRQIAKMSATENRASQIIKVSAKYQAMILKRIAEIKSNAVLKELTNFSNQNSNGDNEMRRSFAGSVTMEDLENFLETTDKHLKRCSEKQLALQKDRDRLSEVNRINESEIINMKKFLTEMSVSFRTFCTVKEVYNQKLSKIVSLQRTVRRDILSLDGQITEATMCKLERGYAAVMQDLSECAMNLERWVDRSVSRMLSAEKIKQAFSSDLDQASLSTGNYQNAAVEVQLSELENSFQKLLAEISRAQKGEGAKTAQEVTIMEVRAEYEDKLNRMKAKMKELFHEEMGRLKQKQADEIAILERELAKSREKMAESSRAYEEHIRALTTELWSVGEKFLVKQEEADWLRRKQSGSLMSLQHVHSSGLQPPRESLGRPSDTYSLRSLPVRDHHKKTEARGLHMSDEEGEVFDNRFLKELSATPRASLAPGQRISELKRRNSLVPPHLKSSYPAEMQFAPTLDEEDIKCASSSFSLCRPQRKEVGITAYKKPGPPTPSKQAGRLSATDSELRESLRTDPDAQSGRKTSTPSRIRSLFRSNRNDMDVGTPRSRRFSNIFRKK